MYYLMSIKKLGISIRRFSAFLIISLSLSVSPSILLAKNLGHSAEESRLKGYEEQEKGNFEQALTYYQKASSFGPPSAALFNDIGITYEFLGNQARAEDNYRKAIEIDPKYLPPYTNLAYLYKAQGRTDMAEQYLSERYWRAAQDDPWKPKILSELLLINPRFKEEVVRREAEQLKQELVARSHQEFSLQLMRSERHYQQGQKLAGDKNFKQAIAEFDRALSLTPENPKIIKAKDEAKLAMDIEDIKQRADMAKDKLDAGEIETARKQFQEILATIPDGSIPSPEK